jgi:hypothetical protein
MLIDILVEFSFFCILGLTTVGFILFFSWILLPLVGIPWLIIGGPQWLWYYVTDGESRTISKEKAFFEAVTYQWQTPTQILDSIVSCHDGQIISCTGTMNSGTVSSMLTHYSGNETLEFKTEKRTSKCGEEYNCPFYKINPDKANYIRCLINTEFSTTSFAQA